MPWCLFKTRSSLISATTDLGFGEPLVTQAGKQIKGVVPGSPAALAGLREGDELAETVATGPSYGSFHPRLTLTVRRGAARVPITYQPQSGQAEAWEWVAAPAKP